jgi:hypothetical protein
LPLYAQNALAADRSRRAEGRKSHAIGG